MNELSNGIRIYVEDSGKTYHTLNDWEFALGNNNYISDPEMETNYINVPYRDGLIDASTALTGRPIYKKRQLSFYLGGLRERENWDATVSSIRNNINGRICRLTLDNDPGYYWRGRVYVENFDRFRRLGSFNLNVPSAEPYKYSWTSSADPWLWDPFNFETDIIIYVGAWTVDGTITKTIPRGHMPVSPEWVVSELVSDNITLTYNGMSFLLTTGTNIVPEVIVGGDVDVEFSLTGQGKVQCVYRSGSL